MMSEEIECSEGAKAARAFRKLAKRVVNVPKNEIDRRAKEWKETRADEKKSK
jgi:hypothetical protein